MKTKCHDLEILTSSTFWTCHPEKKSRHSRNNPCRIKQIIAKTIYVKFDIDKKNEESHCVGDAQKYKNWCS